MTAIAIAPAACYALGPVELAVVPLGTGDVLFRASFEGGTVPSGMSLFDGGGTPQESVTGGEYLLAVDQGGAGFGLWYEDDTAPLRYVNVTGDFDAIATIRVRNTANSGLPTVGDGAYRVAGLAAHDPIRGVNQKNYEHIGLGCLASAAIECEWKDTVDSVSDFAGVAAPTGAGQVRIRHVGTLFQMFYRASTAAAWTMVHEIDRPDMPATLQVGLMAYASVMTPDIRLHCSELVVRRP